MTDYERCYILEEGVAPEIVARLKEPHSKERHGLPFAWMASYHGKDSRQNITYFENAVRMCKLDFPIRVWMNTWSDDIVVSFVPLEAIQEPHIQEWFLSFYEVPVEEAKERLDKFPTYPYNGENPDTVRAALWASGETPAGIGKKSIEHLKSRNIPIIKKF